MGDMSVILEGVESEEGKHSLYSTVHGAGRVMGRREAACEKKWKTVEGLNRKELVTAVAEKSDLEQKTVDSVLRGLQSVLEGAIAKGDKVSVPGFFAVSTGQRAAREGRNPATGETITIKAATTVKFTPGSALKEAANK